MNKIPILIYHAIETPDNPIKLDSKGELVYVINSNDFTQQMKYLRDNEYQVVLLDDYVNHKEELADNALIITYDDGHITNYTVAFPILQEFGIKAAFFITIKNMNAAEGLKADQLREMAKYGMSIQSHTMTHPFLSDLPSQKIREELWESKKILEDELSQPVDYLALPGGRYNSKVREIAIEVGYKAICTSIIGYNNINSDLYHLKRWSIMRNNDISDFRAIIDKSHTFMAYNKTRYILLKTMKKTLGNKFYEILRGKII